MNLSKNQKILLGILHVLPVIAFVIGFIFFFGALFTGIPQMDESNHEPPKEFLIGMIVGYALILLGGLVSLGTLIFDIIHVIKSNKNDTGNKVIIWILVLIFAHTLGSIVYYFVEIMPEKKNNQQETLDQNQLN